MTKEGLEVLNDSEKLVVSFRDKQELIDVNQEELYLIAKNYYANKFSIFQNGNFYLSISNNGTIEVSYQDGDFYLWRTSETFSKYDDDDKIYIHGDNLIEKQFHYSCDLRVVKTSGIYKFTSSHYRLLDNCKKSYFLFNDSNADYVFKKYGFRKSKITKKGIIELFNKMNELGDAIPISINSELNTDSKNLIVEFYKKLESINKKQEELFFIAKDYYRNKYSMLQQGNFYLNKAKWDEIEICYQPYELKVYRFSKTFYKDREEEKYRTYRHGRYENLIEENFSFDCTLKKIITKGICDRYEFSVHHFYKTYVLFNDSNADDVFKKYGFKKTNITKKGITQLFVKMKDDIIPFEYESKF